MQGLDFTQFPGLLMHSREEFKIFIYMFKFKQIFVATIFAILSIVILIATNITKDIPYKDLKVEFKNVYIITGENSQIYEWPDPMG